MRGQQQQTDQNSRWVQVRACKMAQGARWDAKATPLGGYRKSEIQTLGPTVPRVHHFSPTHTNKKHRNPHHRFHTNCPPIHKKRTHNHKRCASQKRTWRRLPSSTRMAYSFKAVARSEQSTTWIFFTNREEFRNMSINIASLLSTSSSSSAAVASAPLVGSRIRLFKFSS